MKHAVPLAAVRNTLAGRIVQVAFAGSRSAPAVAVVAAGGSAAVQLLVATHFALQAGITRPGVVGLHNLDRGRRYTGKRVGSLIRQIPQERHNASSNQPRNACRHGQPLGSHFQEQQRMGPLLPSCIAARDLA